MNAGLEHIALAIKVRRGDKPDDWTDLTSNSGGDPYEGERFSMRAYCWCDGGLPGHEDQCPPNFEHGPSGLIVNWYKHSLRSRSQNRLVSPMEWGQIVLDCLKEVQGE